MALAAVSLLLLLLFSPARASSPAGGPAHHGRDERRHHAAAASTRLGAAPATPPAAVAPAASAAAPPLVRTPKELRFNLLVAGMSGLGKTTACELLFHGWTVGGRTPPLGHPPSTRAINASRAFERFDVASNTMLRVRIIDTPGLGDRLDAKRALGPIVAYAHGALRLQYACERSAAGARARAADGQLHCCLYFVSPSRLLRADILFLRRLQRLMPIVLVIAKADTLTDAELADQRADLRAALAAARIRVYSFLERAAGEGEGEGEGEADGASAADAALETAMARALVGPRYSRGRAPADALAIVARAAVYPWGRVEVDEPLHSDSALLQQLLLSHHAERLVELARERYGRYRAARVRREQLGAWLARLAALGAAARAAGLAPPARLLRTLLLAGAARPSHAGARAGHAGWMSSGDGPSASSVLRMLALTTE
jgi:septin family protein